jgi:hypothetical protein
MELGCYVGTCVTTQRDGWLKEGDGWLSSEMDGKVGRYMNK